LGVERIRREWNAPANGFDFFIDPDPQNGNGDDCARIRYRAGLVLVMIENTDPRENGNRAAECRFSHARLSTRSITVPCGDKQTRGDG
jgi:hypothetical protein